MVVLRVALFALVTLQVGRAFLLARRRRDLLRAVWGNVRWWMWVLVPLEFALVAGTAALLLTVPGFDWGWGRLVGVESNVILSPVVEAAGNNGTAVVVWLERLGAVTFLALLGFVMPLFTLAEERIFRRGLEQGGVVRWAKATVVFGLIHLVVGIPLGVAVALSWGGLAFSLVYLRAVKDATRRPVAVSAGLGLVWAEPLDETAARSSAAAHLAYNITLLGVLAIALLLGI